jgi:hypothetical protein
MDGQLAMKSLKLCKELNPDEPMALVVDTMDGENDPQRIVLCEEDKTVDHHAIMRE